MASRFARLKAFLGDMRAEPGESRSILRTVPALLRGNEFARRWRSVPPDVGSAATPANALRTFFEGRRNGRGVWKWEHYFDIYDRHLSRFVGTDAHLLEIGVHGGGSLDMWLEYLGARATIHGVDILPTCTAYARDRVHIAIGDQADRRFWERFRGETPQLDVVIDDGGHTPEQQIVSLEELLPHLRPGGVYLCEDVHGVHHDFAAYASGLAARLHGADWCAGDALSVVPSAVQCDIQSVHIYPFVVVIERTKAPVERFTAPQHGTEWPPLTD